MATKQKMVPMAINWYWRQYAIGHWQASNGANNAVAPHCPSPMMLTIFNTGDQWSHWRHFVAMHDVQWRLNSKYTITNTSTTKVDGDNSNISANAMATVTIHWRQWWYTGHTITMAHRCQWRHLHIIIWLHWHQGRQWCQWHHLMAMFLPQLFIWEPLTP